MVHWKRASSPVEAGTSVKVRSSRVRVTFNPTDRVFIRMKEDTDEKPREVGGRSGREEATRPRTPGAPKLEKAGRTLSWSLWRDLRPVPS